MKNIIFNAIISVLGCVFFFVIAKSLVHLGVVENFETSLVIFAMTVGIMNTVELSDLRARVAFFESKR